MKKSNLVLGKVRTPIGRKNLCEVNSHLHSLVFRSCLFAAGLALGGVSAASATDLANIPMAVNNLAKPNIMFMIDSSGSMTNIVPDAPFDTAVNYSANCPSANYAAGGFADFNNPGATQYSIFIRDTGQTRFGTGSQDAASTTFGTSGSNKCFNPNAFYRFRLVGDTFDTDCDTFENGADCKRPGIYLPAIYDGNFLNWYFGNPADNYSTAATLDYATGRKSGTQTRMEVAKTSAISVLNTLDRARVGLATYNSATSGAGGELREIMDDMSSSKLTRMTTKINAITPSGATPLAETLSDIGRYFATGYTGNLTLHPGQANQSTATVANVFNNHSLRDNTGGQSVSTAPIQYYCQRSFSVLLTDGRPQGDQTISSDLSDYDGDCASGCGSFDKKPDRQYEPAGSDYLDDVAQALFEIDLRPDLVPTSGIKTTKNNVSTYTIGFADIQASNDPLMQDAATQGDGLFTTAANSAALTQAFATITDNILAKDGSAAAVAVANANVTSGDNASYVSSYNSGTWTGDLIAYPIDPVTGVPNTASPLWTTNCASVGSDGCTAQEQLDFKAAQNGNNASTVRKIVTYTGNSGSGQGRPFQVSDCAPSADCIPSTQSITSTQQSYLNTPSVTDGAAVLSYLRGDRTAEGTTYRNRTHLLGDAINAEPVIVREPFNSFVDDCYSTPVTGKCASSYKTAQASRTRVVLQAANDGMVHVFNAATGAEEWAYIPDILLSLSRDPGNASTSTLNMLSRLSGYAHRFMVDGTPVVGDVDFSNTYGVIGGPDPDWHTIAVGGLGKGGRGFYALDLTTPTASSEADAAAKVLWEFPNSTTNSTLKLNIGYSYGKPVITKTAAYGWVVLVTSGYNNGTGTDNSGGDGHGYVWVLDAKTGNVLNTIDTSVGTPGDPSGLAHIAAWADNANLDNTTTQVYGGDLKGNLWRFDLTDNTGTIDYTARKLAVLKDASGVTQPVTTVPELASIAVTTGLNKRFVFVGTGQYLGDSDVATTQTQTMYGIVDDLSTGSSPVIAEPTRDSLVAQTLTLDEGGTTRTVTSNPVDFTTKKGWYIDLPVTGERISTDPALALGALFFTSNVPSSTACVPGGSSWLNFLDAKTGGLIVDSTVTYSSISLGDALASRPVIIKLPSGAVKVLVRTSDANTTITDAPLPTSGSTTQRSSWREILD